jgi:serine/threonine protein kinase
MAPESISKHKYSVKTDIYAFGILLFEICSHGALPLSEINGRDLAIKRRDENLTPIMPVGSPDILVEITRECWEFDPDLRPTFKMIARKLGEAMEALSDESQSSSE